MHLGFSGKARELGENARYNEASMDEPPSGDDDHQDVSTRPVLA